VARLLYPDKIAFPPAEQRKTPAADQQARRFNLREADDFLQHLSVQIREVLLSDADKGRTKHVVRPVYQLGEMML
jgi:hypothetical protein